MTSAETKGYLNQDIEYTHCTCAICQGDLKPSLCSQVTQGTLSQEKTLNDTDAYE